MFTLTSREAPQKDISRPFLNDTGRSKIAEWNTLTSRWLTSLSKIISAKADTKECKISLISFFFPSLTKTYGPKKKLKESFNNLPIVSTTTRQRTNVTLSPVSVIFTLFPSAGGEQSKMNSCVVPSYAIDLEHVGDKPV